MRIVRPFFCIMYIFFSYYRVNKLSGEVIAFKAHNAFLVCSITEKIHASVPSDFLIDYCELLMKFGFVFYMDSVTQKQFGVLNNGIAFFFFEILRRTGYDSDGNAIQNYLRQKFYRLC